MVEEETGDMRFLLKNGEAKAPKENTSAKDTQRSITSDTVRRCCHCETATNTSTV